MILLVEGPDGSGKSTTINKLLEFFDNADVFTGVPRDWPMQQDYWDSLIYNINTEKRIAIIDRCFISELVYRTIKDDKFNNISISDVLALLSKRYVKVLYCHTANSYKFAKERGETYVKDIKEATEIENMYKYLMKLFKRFNVCKIIEYDWQIDDFNELLKEIKNGN